MQVASLDEESPVAMSQLPDKGTVYTTKPDKTFHTQNAPNYSAKSNKTLAKVTQYSCTTI